MISAVSHKSFVTSKKMQNTNCQNIKFGQVQKDQEDVDALGGLALLILIGGLLVRSCFDSIGEAVKEDNATIKAKQTPAIVDTLVKKVKK